MDTVVVVAIAVLATIFLTSLAAVIGLCSYRYCKRQNLEEDPISEQHRECRPDNQLVNNMEESNEITVDEGGNVVVELDNVCLNSLDHVLNDGTWVHDATGLVPHCLDILKTCHLLTEKLVTMTMRNTKGKLQSPEELTEIVAVARRISPRVDEVILSMYPPMDPRLLEARCTALVLSVSHLVMVTKSACHMSGGLDWIDQSLADVEEHLMVLRQASAQHEATLSENGPDLNDLSSLAVNNESSQL